LKLLLDTHAVLWWLADDPRLSKRARAVIASPSSEPFVSVISIWESCILSSLDRLQVPQPLERWFEASLARAAIALVALETRHLASVASLPWHHKDPFDRALASIAKAEDATIVSCDAIFDRYGVARRW